MKMLSTLILTAAFCVAGSISAAQLDVTVSCSNGATIANLPVQVRDATGVSVPNVNRTDGQGHFIIANSETYVAPFYMFFTATNGSTCGSFSIQNNGSGTANVQLAYYPTQADCSCSKL